MPAKILVVDDEPDILEVVEWCLSAAGYDILTARTGEAALAAVKSSRPDLIILDAGLPAMDGFEVLATLKRDASSMHIPVIMLSGRDRYVDMDKAQKQGCDYYLTKPFNPQQLTRTTKLALAQRALTAGLSPAL